MRFVVIGAPRTGTTMFLITLNTLKEFDTYGEIIGHGGIKSRVKHPQQAIEDFRVKTSKNAISRKNPIIQLDELYQKSSQNNHVGFKFLYPHIINNISLIEGYFNLDKKEVTAVHLKRRNPVKRVISQSLNKYHHYGNGNNNVNVEAILNTVKKSKDIDIKLERLFGKKRYVDMYYEDLTNDTNTNQMDFSKMFDYIGIDLNPIVEVPTKKYGPDKLIDRVGNYNELYGYFKKNAPEYLKYVEE